MDTHYVPVVMSGVLYNNIFKLPSLEVESDLEVFEMKQEIVSLQTKIEDSESENFNCNDC